jgi:ADP-heptose:LPS heptosyltransferase
VLKRALYQVLGRGFRAVRPAHDGRTAARDRFLFLHYETPLGSAVCATPVFAALRRHYPQARVVVACGPVVADVLRHNPHVDRLIPTADPTRRFAAAVADLRRAIAPEGIFDHLVTTYDNARPTLTAFSLFARARRRVGFSLAPAFYDLALEPDPALGTIANNLRALTPFGIGLPNAGGPTPDPEVPFSAGDLERVSALLAAQGVARDAPLVVFVTQTSGGQPSRWYDERLARVADHVSLRAGGQVVFVGAARDAAGIDAIRRAMTRPGVSLAGATSVPEMAALLAGSDLAVCLDTGPMHVARAAGVPMVVVAPAWQPAYEWLPLGLDRCRILRLGDLPCAGCRKFVCATRECMDGIAAHDVEAAVDAMLDRFPPSPAARRERVTRGLRPGEALPPRPQDGVPA